MFKNIYKNKKVVITGNTGFKGSWLTIWLTRLGADVHGVSKDIPTQPSMFERLNLRQQITHYECDIRDMAGLKKIVQDIQPDFFFHLAAQSLVSVSYLQPLETISTNVLGTANILDCIKSLEKDCIGVIITSDKCYENVEWVWGYKETDKIGGKDIYSGSKGAAELIFKSYFKSFIKHQENIKVATARAGNVIGGGDWAKDRIVVDCVKSWSRNKSVEIRSPNSTRPWQHVLEPLSGYLLLGERLSKERKINGESFNFGPKSQNSQTVMELIKSLSNKWPKNMNKEMYEISENNTFSEAGLLKLNCDKALFLLDWSPTLTFDETIDFVGTWYADFYEGKTDMFKLTEDQIRAYEIKGLSKGQKWCQ